MIIKCVFPVRMSLPSRKKKRTFCGAILSANLLLPMTAYLLVDCGADKWGRMRFRKMLKRNHPVMWGPNGALLSHLPERLSSLAGSNDLRWKSPEVLKCSCQCQLQVGSTCSLRLPCGFFTQRWRGRAEDDPDMVRHMTETWPRGKALRVNEWSGCKVTVPGSNLVMLSIAFW